MGWRHYLLLAALVHIGVVVLLTRIDMKHSGQAIERELARSEALTHNARTQQRVRDLEKIKALLEESNREQPEGGRASPDLAQLPAPEFSASSLPEKPAELLERARVLSKQIDRIDKEMRAAELADILKVSKEEALKQVEADAQAKAQDRARLPDALPSEASARQADASLPGTGQSGDSDRQVAADPQAAQGQQENAATDGQVAAEVEKLEARAVEVLKRRREQLSRHGSGARLGRGAVADGASQVQERISSFINRDLPLNAYQSTLYRNGAMDLGGQGRVPPVDASAILKGTGRMLGPGGVLTNRLYLNSWYLIGPFQGKHGLDRVNNYRYPPEDAVVLDATYRGKDGRLLRWQYISSQSYPLIPPDQAEDAVYYGYTELMSDEEVDVIAWIGADDDGKVWLNDRQIWAGGERRKDWFWNQLYHASNTHRRDFNYTEAKRQIHLRKGRNKLFFKLSNGATLLFFSMVLEPVR
jgi:hypothetical protein